MLLAPARVHDQVAFRSITIDTTEVTAPAMAVAPDGGSLIVSALGHLYQLPRAVAPRRS